MDQKHGTNKALAVFLLSWAAQFASAAGPTTQGTACPPIPDAFPAFVVPAVCLAGVALYALFDLRTTRHAGPLVTEGAAH